MFCIVVLAIIPLLAPAVVDGGKTGALSSCIEELEVRLDDIEKAQADLQAFKDNYSGPCQSGVVGFFDWPKVLHSSWVGTNLRTKTVTFSEPFKKVPTVTAALSFIDSDFNRNLRVECTTDTVTLQSFQLKCRSWSNTLLYGLKASWFAC